MTAGVEHDARSAAGNGRNAGTVVVAIATSAEERVRIAELLGGHSPVLLVATAEEALTVLHADEGAGDSEQVTQAEPVDPGPRTGWSGGVSGIEIDSDWRTARWEGRTVPLTPLEHDLLVCLMREAGRTMTFERVHRQVWGNEHLGDHTHVHSVVKRLRRKLEQLGSTLRIDAVRGVGLRMADGSPRRVAQCG